jgi:glycerol kinase
MQDLLLALDQGTTGTTALVLDRGLRVRGRATVGFPQYFPEPGWVEHEPEEIWASVVSAIAGALGRLDPVRIAAIGITNQRETTFAWDAETGAGLGRAIVWQDRRTTEACAALKAHGPRIRALTGLPLDPYFSATKLAWLKARHPGRKLAFGTSDSFVIQRLSGEHVTDPSNASRTMLYDIHRGGWSEELMALFGVEGVRMPRVVPSAGPCARSMGLGMLPDGIPIAGVAGDQQAALFGQGCFEAGQAKITYGTGSFVLVNSGSKAALSEHGLITTVAWDLGQGPVYALEGGTFVAGALIQWLRDGLGIIANSAEVEALAASVPDSGGVAIIPALAGLGAPHWRPEARGLIAGLTRGSTRAHLARAALEGIAHSQCDILEAMEAELGAPLKDLRVDGGAAANNLLMQLQADLSGLTLRRPGMLEATALGAGMLAGLGLGWWTDLKELAEALPVERLFEPRLDREAARLQRQAWQRVQGFA